MKYAYPAVLKREEDGSYSVFFPDLEGCYTGGEDIPDALEMAQDALCLWLYHMEEDGTTVPVASPMNKVRHERGDVVSLVVCDTLEYKKFFGSQAVRKTVTIPAWLNTMAEQADISFSSVLQSGLKQALGLSNK